MGTLGRKKTALIDPGFMFLLVPSTLEVQVLRVMAQRPDEQSKHLPTSTMNRSCGLSLHVLLSLEPSISVRRKCAEGLLQAEYM